MSDSKAFGRRQTVSATAPAPKPLAEPAPTSDLNAAAETLRAEIAAKRAASTGFAQWRRSYGARQLLVWTLTLASFAPGLITFAMDAPLSLSILLELISFAGNIWLRRERRRRMRAIVDWQDPADTV